MPKLDPDRARQVKQAGRERAAAIADQGGIEVQCGDGGVVRVDGLCRGPVYLQLKLDQAGELRIFDLLLEGRQPLRASDLRAIRIDHLEQIFNTRKIASLIIERLNTPTTDLAIATRSFGGVDVISGAEQPEEALTRYERTSLTKPSRRSDRGQFLRNVAAAYEEARLSGKAPARLIHEETGEPPTTAHSWIKEARKRGYLAPGKPGYTKASMEITIQYVGKRSYGEVPPVAWGDKVIKVKCNEPKRLPIDIALNLLADEENWQPVPHGEARLQNASR